jgi:uncharacterized protein YqfA (UPF0365 family)
MNAIIPVIVGVVALLLFVLMVVFFSILRLWVRAMMSGVSVPVLHIVGMRFRGNPAQLLIDAYILLSKEGVQTTLGETEYVFVQNRNRVRIPEDLVRLVKDHKEKK